MQASQLLREWEYRMHSDCNWYWFRYWIFTNQSLPFSFRKIQRLRVTSTELYSTFSTLMAWHDCVMTEGMLLFTGAASLCTVVHLPRQLRTKLGSATCWLGLAKAVHRRWKLGRLKAEYDPGLTGPGAKSVWMVYEVAFIGGRFAVSRLKTKALFLRPFRDFDQKPLFKWFCSSKLCPLAGFYSVNQSKISSLHLVTKLDCLQGLAVLICALFFLLLLFHCFFSWTLM